MRCWIHHQTLFVDYQAYGVAVDIDRTPALFDAVPGARSHTIRADSARPETISFMRRHGYDNMVGVTKWSGSVEDGIAHLRSYEKIVIHRRCEHTAMEMRLYSFKVDRLSGDVLPQAIDANNHCIDALRYALEPLVTAPGAGLLAFYQAEGQKVTAAAKDDDPHHRTERVWLTGASAPQLPFERAKAEGGVVRDCERH